MQYWSLHNGNIIAFDFLYEPTEREKALYKAFISTIKNMNAYLYDISSYKTLLRAGISAAIHLPVYINIAPTIRYKQNIF